MHRPYSPHLLSQLNRYDRLEPVGRGTSSRPTATHSTPLNAAPSPG